MEVLLQMFCFCVAVAGGPYPQVAHQSGDIWYTHELLGRGTHLLRLSTTDLILDSDYDREGRLATFAQQFADQTCRGRYKLNNAERVSWPKIRPVYAKQYVFHCV
jgi:hypothetical protein